MAKQTTSMADQPGSAPAGDPPKTQDAPAAAPVAASEAPAATVDDVAALRAQLAEATANTDAKIQAAVAAAVGAALAGISHPAKPADEATVDQRLAKMDRERKEREEANSKIDAWLESGPLKFDISMSNEPRMNRRVGGVSQDEAQAKYMRFFGITAIVDPGKRINVTAVS